ncbi:hypothetical protein B7494_g2452 [Chlorociboria aeruginascens]|nr:hypothetical protein B7494_g2452 [Chlorociboria aeruginascens]
MNPHIAIGAVASIDQLSNAASSLLKHIYGLDQAVAFTAEDLQALASALASFAPCLNLLSNRLKDSKSRYTDGIYLLTAKIIKDCAGLYDNILMKFGGKGTNSLMVWSKFVAKEGHIKELVKRLQTMKATVQTILLMLSVDSQLSTLPIASPTNLQRAPDRSLLPETLSRLKEAEDAVDQLDLPISPPGSICTSLENKPKESLDTNLGPPESAASKTNSSSVRREPVFLNSKQSQRIIKRRAARQKIEQLLPPTKSKGAPQPRLYRHRMRGHWPPSLRERFAEQARPFKETSTEDSGLVEVTVPSDAQPSTLWWQAYASLSLTNPKIITTILAPNLIALLPPNSQLQSFTDKEWAIYLRQNLHVLNRRNQVLCIDPLPQRECKDDVIIVVLTICSQLGLEGAVVAWGCVIAALKKNPSIEILHPLHEVVGMIARYTVMETLYRCSPALALHTDYHATLVDLCTSILKYFAYIIQDIDSGNPEKEKCREGGRQDEERGLLGRVRELDLKCRGYRVTVMDVDGDEDEREVLGLNDEMQDWEIVDSSELLCVEMRKLGT